MTSTRRAVGVATALVTALACGGAATSAAARPSPTRTPASAEPVAPVPGAAGKPVLGAHRVLVAPVYWTAPGDATTEQISSVLGAVDRDYDAWTGGKVRFAVDQVKAWTRIDLTAEQISSCDLPAIERATRAAVGSTTADQYHHIVAYLQNNPACSFNGIGYVGTAPAGDGFAWVNNSLTTGVWSRTLGYNLGLENGGSLACWADAAHTTPVPLSEECQQQTLDDPWDTMGNQPYATGFMSAANLEKLGALEDAAVVNIAWDQELTLAPVSGRSGVRGATVVNGPNTYYLEYRAPVGMDGWIDDHSYVGGDGVLRTDPGGGLIVRRLRGGFGKAGETDVVDFHPDRSLAPSKRHPGLDAPEDYTTPSGDVKFAVLSASDEGARVKVTFPRAAGIYRWAGDDRYEASASISANSFRMRTDTVYVASGQVFTDALSGAGVAGKVGAPMLLASRDALTADITKELGRLRPDKIVVLGGPATVSDAVVDDLQDLAPTRRVAGADRYETSAAISAANYQPGVATAYVASGENFPDALAGAPIAGKTGGPMLLVRGTSIPPSVAAELTRLRPGRIVVLGGPATVAESVVADLQPFASAGVERWAGEDRYAVSAGISQRSFPSGSDTVFVASGAIFTDALSGAPVAGKTPGPLLLLRSDQIPMTVATELTRLRPKRVVILGGPASVDTTVAKRLRAYLAK